MAIKVLKKAFVVEGIQFYFDILKNPKNDPKEPFPYLITTLNLAAKAIGDIYSLRWKIEYCFEHLKTNSFQLEQISLKTESRCRLLMAITVFAYVISIPEGLKTYKKVPITPYKDGSKEKQELLFRHGVNKIMAFYLSFSTFCTYFLTKIEQSKKRKISTIIKNVY